MHYSIKGDNFPVVVCEMTEGESLITEAGAMGWMSDNFKMDTNMKGGLMGGISRMFSGESIFLNTYTCSHGVGSIAFPSSFPGKLIARELSADESIICQKGAFLAGSNTLSLEVHFRKKLSTGFFGGEGFILQKVTGPGIVFLEFDGYIEEILLAPGEKLKVDTGNVAMFEPSVNFDIEMIKGVKNMLFGGEGLFLTTLTGPGKVYVQSMPIQNLAGRLSHYMYTGSEK
ncbi:TIGR00266 family protein [Clostridium hydrogeniformans]|uniref:TIGR00266 family protein n=1 Tax=Clostridium hydrogeniformans TaxID=349933 RepID=UPI0004837930|nr:TIGR00266 family protein [Clostridium hydrogeniformans]